VYKNERLGEACLACEVCNVEPQERTDNYKGSEENWLTLRAAKLLYMCMVHTAVLLQSFVGIPYDVVVGGWGGGSNPPPPPTQKPPTPARITHAKI
jgi:hypothetical protein